MSTRLWRVSWREAGQRQTTRWKTTLVMMMMIDDKYDHHDGNHDDYYDDADRNVRILIKVNSRWKICLYPTWSSPTILIHYWAERA